MMELNHLASYEFLGKFWYVDNNDIPMTGKLTYTPEMGIRLELLNPTNTEINELKNAKVMHAVLLHKEDIKQATLFDVFIYPQTIYMNSGTQQRIYGGAGALVWGGLLENNKILSLDVEYDEYFKNAVYCPGEEITHALQYEKKTIKTLIGKIKLSSQYTGRGVFSKEAVDELLWAFPWNEAKLKKLKKIITKYIEDNHVEVFKRTSAYSTVSFENSSKNYFLYCKNEKIWRSFWEILINHPISVKKCWIKAFIGRDIESNKRYYFTYSVLFSHINSHTNKYNRVRHKYHMPLTMDSFGKDLNLSKLYSPLSKWIDMCQNKRLDLLMSGLTKIIYQQNKITTDDYMSLITYIETAIDFLGSKENKLSVLISNYADKEWLGTIKSIIGELPSNKNVAGFLTEVRNVITHPKSAGKAGGIYMDFALNDIKLQAAYSCLVGLLFKVIVKYLYNFEELNLKEYSKEVISSRRWYKIIYK